MTQVLRIDASMRHDGSTTRTLTDQVIDRLAPASVVTRDLADTAPGFVDADWIGANFTPADTRTPAQAGRLAQSDALIAELQAADVVVLGVPVYNFGVPAALKAWIDQVARAGVTFKYTETGPIGLLEGKRAIVIVATGGTPVDSAIDFATPYMRHVLGFLGIHDVTVVAADRQMVDADAAIAKATDGIAQIAA